MSPIVTKPSTSGGSTPVGTNYVILSTQGSTHSVPNDGTQYTIPFANGIVEGGDGFTLDVPKTQLTVAVAGRYSVALQSVWDASDTTGVRTADIYLPESYTGGTNVTVPGTAGAGGGFPWIGGLYINPSMVEHIPAGGHVGPCFAAVMGAAGAVNMQYALLVVAGPL
jgi:hypothetical protein